MAWKRFGIVLIDKPPIVAASGALLLAGIAECVVLTVRAGSADRNELRSAKDQLGQPANPVLSAVLNQCNPNMHVWPSQPYHGYCAMSENERSNGTSNEAETRGREPGRGRDRADHHHCGL